MISKIGPKLSYAPAKKFVVMGLISIAIEFVLTTLLDIQIVEDSGTLYMVTSYFTIVTSGMVKLQYATAVFLIRERFKRLNQNLNLLEFNMHTVSLIHMMDFSKHLNNNKGDARFFGWRNVCPKQLLPTPRFLVGGMFKY